MQKWLHDNELLIYSTHDEGKSVVAKRSIRSFKCNIYNKRQLMVVNVNWLFE